jgi:two-component system response regulator GlrR
MNKSAILLVDDDPEIRKLLSLRLAAAGYEVSTAESGEKALAQFARSRPDLVITDLKMGGMDGMALFKAMHEQAPGVPVIVLTAHGTIPDAVEAIKLGVFGFIPKPFEPKALLDQVAQALRSAAGDRGGVSDEWRRDIVTRSALMEDMLRRAYLVAQSDASVFIHGASGSGKELLARAIHGASGRAARPFVAVNCAAIPENLLESELFGHRKGAFTGAAYEHTGLIPSANGGSLFLDEIGDMPLALQAKLLRVLQEREVRPVGSAWSVEVDVRVLSASHQDLDARMTSGDFREDLYYRLNVVSLSIPALTERPEDIPLLASYFLSQTAKRYVKEVRAFSPDAIEMLVGAPWPGNVRQLQNVVEQVVALAQSAIVPASLVQSALRERANGLAPLDEARREFERDYLVRLLKITAGSVSKAARLAGRNRTEFYKLLERHHLEPAVFRGG